MRLIVKRESQRWSDEDEAALREAIAYQVPLSKIAQITGRSRASITSRAHQLGITGLTQGSRRRRNAVAQSLSELE
jgi:3-deoxy-D-manno-octulosonate 8-phosphate phosphatase KdsC-like HAD superfamily phosphatase